VSAVVEPAIGLLADVWRRRVLVVGGGLGFALGLALAATSSGLLHLLLAFCLLSPASGAFVGLSQATLMDAEPTERERNMVRWTLAGAAGALAGPACVSAAAALALGWRPLFLAFAGLALALAWSVSRFRFPSGREASELPQPLRASLAATVVAIRRVAVLRWLLLLEAADLLLDVLLGFLALYLVDVAGLSAAAAALAVSAWLAAGLLGNLALLPLLRRTSGVRYLRASAVAAGLLFAGFLLVPSAAAKLALLLPLGLVNAGWYPILKARLYAELPGRSGAAMALASLTAPLAAFPPLAVGALAALYGLDAALWLLLIAPAALLLLLPREKPDARASSPGPDPEASTSR
jgi:FSR family fosmidomycin resistance protein-like MFS transporter